MSILTQTNILRSAKYTIAQNGLEIAERTFFRKSKQLVHFEDIGSKISAETINNPVWVYVFFVFSAMGTFRLIVSGFNDNSFQFFIPVILFSALLLLLTRRKILKLEGGSMEISFSADKPTAQKLNTFINELLEKRNNILRIKYGTINSKISYETQHERILWLNNLGVFSDEEFIKAKKELDRLFESPIEGYEYNPN